MVFRRDNEIVLFASILVGEVWDVNNVLALALALVRTAKHVVGLFPFKPIRYIDWRSDKHRCPLILVQFIIRFVLFQGFLSLVL